jgi:hypothetical protein
MTPVRIQRRRTRGYDMQAVSLAINGLPCISVTRPGRWGNPYDVRVFGRELSMALFRETMDGCWSPSLVKDVSDELCDLAYAAHCAFMKRIRHHPAEAARDELRGHNLACYCAENLACHSSILLEIASQKR